MREAEKQECKGWIGRFAGHDFVARENYEEDGSKIDRLSSVNGSSGPAIIQALKIIKRVYLFTECTRCGLQFKDQSK